MLLRFSVANFRSFKSEQVFDLEVHGGSASRGVQCVERVGDRTVTRNVNNAVGVFGANASGKTSLLAGLDLFAESAVNGRPDHYQPHRFDKEAEGQPTTFSVECLLEGTRYEYGFSYVAKAVHREWLYSFTQGRRRTLFLREGADASLTTVFPGRHFVGPKAVITKSTRGDRLLLRTAAELNNPVARSLLDWLSNVGFARRKVQTQEMLSSAGLNREIQTLLSSADLGIEAAATVVPMDDGFRALIERLREDNIALDFPDEELQVNFTHTAPDGGSFVLPELYESAGTRTWFQLIGPALEVLTMGGVLIVDELGGTLHHRLSSQLISLFEGSQRAQLVFSTHNAQYLRASAATEGQLEREQIWFVEKNKGESEIYAMTDFAARSNENLRAGYMAGRYGAVPALSPGQFSWLLESERS